MTTTDRKMQLGIGVDATEAREGFASVKDAARDMASAVVAEGQKAGKSVEALGNSTAGAADKIDRDSRSIAQSIRRANSSIAEMGDGAEKAATRNTAATQRMEREMQRFLVTAGAGGKEMAAYWEQWADFRGADRAKLQPLIDQVELLRIRTDAAAAAKRELDASQAFERQAAQAQKLNQASQYVRFWADALQEADKAQAKVAGQNAFIDGLQRQSQAIGKTRADLLELQAAQLGVGDRAAPFIAQLRASEQGVGRLGVSAGQTAQAIRMLPAQMTDVVTQLAVGQNPLLILIQQGGQVKDSFGGLGPMFRTLAGMISPVAVAVAGAAGSVGLLGLALVKVESAARGLNTLDVQLTATGRAADFSKTELKGLIEEMARMPGVTKGSAQDALSEFTKTSQLGSEIFRGLSGSVADFARATGTDVPTAARKLADAFADPAKGAQSLEKALGTLKAEQMLAIEEMARSNDTLGAQRLLLAELENATRGLAVNGMTPLQAASNELGNAWDAAMRSFGDSSPIATATGLLVGLLNTVRGVAESLPNLGKQWEGAFSGGLNGMALKGAQWALGVPASTAGGAGRPAGQSGGATGSYGSDSDDADKAIKNALALGAAFKSTSARGDELAASVAAMSDALEAARKNPEKYARTIKELEDRIGGAREQMAKLGKSAATDGANALVQTYRNADKAILDDRKDFFDRLHLQAKLGTKSELEVIESSMEEEQKTWAARQANFALEAAAAGKKKDASTEVQRINGQLQDAERDHQQAMAKLEGDRALLYQKNLDFLDQMVDQANTAARATQEQIRQSALEGLEIGKTGAELGALRQARVEETASHLEALAAGKGSIDQSGRLSEAYRAQAKNVRDLAKANGENAATKVVRDYARALEETIGFIEKEQSLAYGSQRDRNIALEQYRIEIDLKKKLAEIDANTTASPEVRAQRRTELTDMGERAKQAAAQRVDLDEWRRAVDEYDEVFRKGFAGMLNGGENTWKAFTKSLATTFKTTVADQIYKAFAQPLVIRLVGSLLGITGVGGSGVAQAAGLAGNAGGLSGAGSAMSWLTDFGGSADTAIYKLGGKLFENGLESLGGTLLDHSATIGQGLETLGNGLGYLNSILALKDGNYGQAAGAALGTYFGGPIGSVIGSTIGKYIDKAFGGETRVGGQFAVAYNDQVVNNRRGQTYTYQGQQYDRDFSNGARDGLINGQAYRLEGDPVSGGQDDAIKKAVAGTATGIGDMLKALGSKVTVSGFWAGLETSEKGRGGVFAGGALSNGAMFGESGKGDNYKGTLYEKFSSNSPDFKAALENFTLDLKQSAIQALQGVGDIPESVKKKLAGVDAEALTAEAADALLTAINTQIAGVTQFKTALDAMGMDRFADLSFDAAAGIGELSGGFDKLQANLGSYYENFFSAEERRNNLKSQIEEQLGNLGLDMPDIDSENARAQYRALIEAQDPATESGQKTIAMLLQLAGAFASVTDAAGASAEAANTSAAAVAAREKEIADKRFSIQQQILRAEGKDREALDADRAREYAAAAALSPELAELTNHLWEIQDAAEAAAAATKLANAGRDQDIQIMELQGNAAGALAARRDVELAAMDPLLREKQKYIYALQDEAAATAAAAAAKAEADARDKEIGDTEFDYRQRLLRAQGKDREALDRDRAKEYARLMALNPALAELANNLWLAEDAATAAAAAQKAVEDAYAALERSVDARRSAVQSMEQVAQESVEMLSGIFETLKSNIDELYGEVSATRAMSAAEGQAFLLQALGAARTTGYLPEGQQLTEAIAAARGGLDSKSYASKLDYDRDRLVLAASLDELKGYTGEQLSTAEQQVKLAEDELKRLDDTLKIAKNQLDALQGVNTSVLSVAEAVAAFQDAVLGKKPAGTTSPAGGGAVVGAGTGGTSAGHSGSALGKQSSGTYVFSDGYVTREIAGAEAARLDAAAGIVAKFNGTGNVKGYYEAMREAGYTLRDIAARDGYFYGDVLAAAQAAGVPAFRVGTNYVPRDMLAQIHEGEAIVPRAYNPAANPAANTSRTDELLRELREGNKLLRAENLALVKALQQMQLDVEQIKNAGVVVRTQQGQPLETAAA